MNIQLDSDRTLTGHSSTVSMWLHIDGNRHAVLQSGEDAIKLYNADLLPQADADLEIIIDGRSRRWPIRLLGADPRPNWISITDR